jgi:UDP-MurNAc hydroxylase
VRVRALGHAGLELTYNGVRVLCDPWFSPEGAFQGSWFQFPENQHLLTSELVNPTAIVISHEHMDHVDPWFLARVPLHVPVIVPRYPSPILRYKVLSGGKRPIVELDSWQRYELAPGLEVFFVSEESPMNHDSAMVLVAGGRSLLNMNDARLFASQLRNVRAELGGKVDLLALQGAGASWYPMCYDYPEDRMVELCVQKRLAKLRYVQRVINIVEPLMSLPFAGPPCFLDADLFQHNQQLGDHGIFPDQFQVAQWLGDHGIDTTILLPGDTWDAAQLVKEPSPVWDGYGQGDQMEYLLDYQGRRLGQVAAVKERYPVPSNSLWPAFEDYFGQVLTMNDYFNERIGFRVGFEIKGPGGGNWAVDFRPGHLGTYQDLGDCQYLYRFDSRWLPAILEDRVPWEDFLLSLRFSAWRDPDVYSDHLLGLLKFARPDPLTAVEAYETQHQTEETVEVQIDGKTYRIQRYCPHAGQDLRETGELISGGILRCLGHNYEFDLATGQCLNGDTRPIRTELVT